MTTGTNLPGPDRVQVPKGRAGSGTVIIVLWIVLVIASLLRIDTLIDLKYGSAYTGEYPPLRSMMWDAVLEFDGVATLLISLSVIFTILVLIQIRLAYWRGYTRLY